MSETVSVWSLWLPMLLTALATHVMSTLAWTVSPHHKKEWGRLPVEGDLEKLLDENNVPAGQYFFPAPPQLGGDAEGGGRGTLVVWNKPPAMGTAVALTLAFFVATAWVIGYLASLGVAAGAAPLDVFQFVFTAAVLAHAFGLFPGNFWFPKKVALDLVDKLAYAVVTGLIFATLWPPAA